MGQNPADFPGFHAKKVYALYGDVPADSGHSVGVLGAFLVMSAVPRVSAQLNLAGNPRALVEFDNLWALW